VPEDIGTKLNPGDEQIRPRTASIAAGKNKPRAPGTDK